MLYRDCVRLTELEMQRIIKDYALDSYHIKVFEDGSYELRFGENDPLELLKKAELEIETMKVQIRYLLTKVHKIDYTKAEELVK